MDFNTSSVPPNHDQLPSIMSPPPYQLDLPQYHQQDREKQELQQFWQQQILDVQNTEAFKNQQQLPLARIKRIMKADGDVKMISAEAPLLFAKACEVFILELTLRAWMRTKDNKRRTLQRCDIANAIRQDDALVFLAHVVPCHDHHHCYPHHNKEENAEKNAEGNHAILPHTAGYMGNPTMDTGSERVAINQQFPPPHMMQPPFITYYDQFPHNF